MRWTRVHKKVEETKTPRVVLFALPGAFAVDMVELPENRNRQNKKVCGYGSRDGSPWPFVGVPCALRVRGESEPPAFLVLFAPKSTLQTHSVCNCNCPPRCAGVKKYIIWESELYHAIFGHARRAHAPAGHTHPQGTRAEDAARGRSRGGHESACSLWSPLRASLLT